MKSVVVIERRGISYIASASGKFGGGYQGASAGDTALEAAIFAAREMIRYGRGNPEGVSLIAPPEVADFMSSDLKQI